MTARLTVVLKDDGLYRRAKVRAAEAGIPLMQLIEEALSRYLTESEEELPVLTTESWEAWQARFAKHAEEEGYEGPTDLSDVKKYLYGYTRQRWTPEEWEKFVDEANRENGFGPDFP